MLTDQIMYCIVTLILGMLMFLMLSNVCACENVVEGQNNQYACDGYGAAGGDGGDATCHACVSKCMTGHWDDESRQFADQECRLQDQWCGEKGATEELCANILETDLDAFLGGQPALEGDSLAARTLSQIQTNSCRWEPKCPVGCTIDPGDHKSDFDQVNQGYSGRGCSYRTVPHTGDYAPGEGDSGELPHATPGTPCEGMCGNLDDIPGAQDWCYTNWDAALGDPNTKDWGYCACTTPYTLSLIHI